MNISQLKTSTFLHFGVRQGRGICLQVVEGGGSWNRRHVELSEGAGAAVTDASVLELVERQDAEIILCDLPAQMLHSA